MNLVKLAKWTLFYVLQWAVLYAASYAKDETFQVRTVLRAARGEG